MAPPQTRSRDRRPTRGVPKVGKWGAGELLVIKPHQNPMKRHCLQKSIGEVKKGRHIWPTE